MFTHEDNRRTLIEWATGEFKVAKVLIAKEDCVVGDHWHRNKDETFYLLSGTGMVQIGEDYWGIPVCDFSGSMKVINCGSVTMGCTAPMLFHVPRGTYHRFELAKGSVLLGVGTEAFDPKDEIAGRPPEPMNIQKISVHPDEISDIQGWNKGKIIEGGT